MAAPFAAARIGVVRPPESWFRASEEPVFHLVVDIAVERESERPAHLEVYWAVVNGKQQSMCAEPSSELGQARLFDRARYRFVYQLFRIGE